MIIGASIGKMDLRVIIESATTSSNSSTNEPEETWSTFHTCWAERLRNTFSDEVVEGDQKTARTYMKLRIRWVAGITEQMRLNVDGAYHYIKGIEEWGRKSYLIITTEKRDNE